MSKAASAVARKKGYGGTSKGFRPHVPLLRGGVRLYVEGGNPRRTPLIGKIAIYGWKLVINIDLLKFL
jgi:hypothetical protein